jgi:hypothetical protein
VPTFGGGIDGAKSLRRLGSARNGGYYGLTPYGGWMPRDLEILMWAEACQMLERAERLQRRFFQLGDRHAGGPAEARAGFIHRLEIPHGRFERRITLAPGSYEVGRRDLVNGCLTLSLRRRPS